jgi:PAS domain S-box-containing protein
MVGPPPDTRQAPFPRVADRLQVDALFRTVLDSAPDAIILIDAGGRIVLANAQTESLFGYGAHELLGGPVDLLLPEERVTRRATDQAGPRTRPLGAGLDVVARRKDGTEFPVKIDLSPVATDDGMLITAVVRDVSEREEVLARERQARRKDEESLALLRTLLTAAPFGIASSSCSRRLPSRAATPGRALVLAGSRSSVPNPPRQVRARVEHRFLAPALSGR